MRRFVLLAVAPFVLCGLAACRSEPGVEEPDPHSDPFSIVLSRHDALPDLPPGIEGDTLVLRVQYPGGCSDHEFTVSQTMRGDTTLLSVRHQNGGDGCEALVYDELRLPLPEEFAPRGPVLLRNPEGGVPFRLQ